MVEPMATRDDPARRRKPGKARCPMCGHPMAADYAPFCSRHCADDDLAGWLGGRYAIPGEHARGLIFDDDTETD